MVIDNAQNGFTLYRLEGAAKGPIRTFLTDLPKMQVPKQVVFREECHIVVDGSDNGFVYIFEHASPGGSPGLLIASRPRTGSSAATCMPASPTCR